MTNLNNLSTVSAVASLLSLTPSAVSNWTKADDFPAPTVVAGRTRLWDTGEVLAWAIAEGRVKSPAALRQLADVIESALFPESDDDAEPGILDSGHLDAVASGDFDSLPLAV